MLISHRKEFIFTKTVKTAGTSVESYFEKYCMPEGEWRESHTREEYISEAGIIGYRGGANKDKTWYNHMPAKTIRDQIGQDMWDRYYKFTIVRNPFDKLISGFFFYGKNGGKVAGKLMKLKAKVRQVLDIEEKVDKSRGQKEIERFRSWIHKGGSIIDRNKYMIDGEENMDYFIRYEHLHEDMKHVCDQLSIPFEPSLVPQFKKGLRKHSIPIQDYYDTETYRIVREKYAWEVEKFGYDLPKLAM